MENQKINRIDVFIKKGQEKKWISTFYDCTIQEVKDYLTYKNNGGKEYLINDEKEN